MLFRFPLLFSQNIKATYQEKVASDKRMADVVKDFHAINDIKKDATIFLEPFCQ